MPPKPLDAELIRNEALRIGFDACGISRVKFLEKEARQLEQFLSEKRHGNMTWLERNFDKRTNPGLLVDHAKSIISVIANYKPDTQIQVNPEMPKISSYAWGRDYHYTLKEKLENLLSFIRETYGNVNARIFVDSAPVMDKVWAQYSGLGWIGKHTNLIRKGFGSWFFIGEIIIDLELSVDAPVSDHCGTCTRCIDACPTEALQAYQIDASRCISYLTIELKESMSEEMRQKSEGWAFGCDICQAVCPWNSQSLAHTSGWFQPLPFILSMSEKEWMELPDADFKKQVKDSPLSRIKPGKWKDNLRKS